MSVPSVPEENLTTPSRLRYAVGTNQEVDKPPNQTQMQEVWWGWEELCCGLSGLEIVFLVEFVLAIDAVSETEDSVLIPCSTTVHQLTFSPFPKPPTLPHRPLITFHVSPSLVWILVGWI